MKTKLVVALFCFGVMTVGAIGQKHPVATTNTNKALSADETAAVAAYWTPERMASAKPMELIAADPTNVGEAQTIAKRGPQVLAEGKRPKLNLPADTETSEQVVRSQESGNEAAVPAAFTYEYPFTTYADPDHAKYPEATVGTLFFTLEGADFRCSASVIRPHTIVTARHCVFDYSTSTWASNEVFYPGWTAGKLNKKFGGAWVWRVAETWTSGAPGFNYDIAFLQLADHSGSGCNGSSGTSPVEDYTGYLGYAYNGDFSQRQWAVLGYPAAVNTTDGNPFAGKFLIRSDAATGNVNDNLGGDFTNTVEVGSDQTGGASGGPWIIGYNPATAATFKFGANSTLGTSNDGNYANSVNSFKFTSPNHPLAINGPEFDDYNFLNLLTDYETLSCP
jgi:hypothetical protein